MNGILSFFQNILNPLREKSLFLQKTDCLIGFCILGVIISSTFAPSDYIGYFGIFTIILTVIKLLTQKGLRLEPNSADLFLLAYFMLVLISTAGASLFYLSLKGFLKTGTYLGFYVSVLYYLKDNKDKIKYIFITIAFCALFESFTAFIQHFMSISAISGWQDTSRLNPEEVMTRVYGTLKPYNPNLFGGYLLVCLPSFLVFPIKRACAGFLLTSCALLFTGCRGAYIGFFFELAVLMGIIYKLFGHKYRKIFAAVSSLIATFGTFLVLSSASLKARIFSIFAMRADSSNSFRFNVYQSCINMFKDNALLGIGVGNQNFREIYGLYMITGFDALSAYNIYLEIAVESGIFALISFIGFLILLIKKAFQNINSPYTAAALVAILGVALHGFVDTVFFRPQLQFIFWVMAAVIQTSKTGTIKQELA